MGVALPPFIIRCPSIKIVSPFCRRNSLPSFGMTVPSTSTFVPSDIVTSWSIAVAGWPAFIIIILPPCIITPSMSAAAGAVASSENRKIAAIREMLRREDEDLTRHDLRRYIGIGAFLPTWPPLASQDLASVVMT